MLGTCKEVVETWGEKRGLVHIFYAIATNREDSLLENVYLSPLFAPSGLVLGLCKRTGGEGKNRVEF